MKSFLTIAATICYSCLSAQTFTPGNIVVGRFGDGITSSKTSKTVPVFLDEYTPAGVLVQTIGMPTAVSGSNRRLTAIGNNNYQGSLYRSADGQYLTLMGYDANVNTDSVLTSSAATVNRIAGMVSYNGTVNTSTAISAPIDIPRSAVTSNGYQFWVGGSASALYYVPVGNGGAAASLGLPAGYRSLQIFNNQLYATSSGSTAFRIGKIGNDLPSAGTQTVASLPGIPTTSGSPNQVVFFDTDNNKIPDLLYYADDALGSIVKYALVNGTWTARGSATVALTTQGIKGITGILSSGIVKLYAVTIGSGTTPSALLTLSDSTGTTLANTVSITQVVTAPSNTSFRGIALAPAPMPAVSYQPVQAAEFVDRIGVNTHPPTQRFNGVITPHADTVTFKARLFELGAKHIRVNVHPTTSNWAFWNGLYASHAIKMLPIIYPSVWTSLSAAVTALKNNVSLLDAVEGPNETDYEGISYNGQTFPQGTIAYQNDLYAGIKGDTTLQHLSVLAPTAGNPVNYPLLRGANFDVKNIHYYPWNLPADHIDSQISNSDSITTTPMPVWTSETGYSTYNQSVTEKAQGKYIPRLLCHFFNRGIYRAYIYQLVDRGTDTSQREQFFGLCRNNWTPKPAFYVLKNLITTLKDSGATFTPTPLSFSITGDVTNVRTFLVQKGNGDHYLLIWNDVRSFDSNSRTDVDLPPVPVILTFPENYSNVSLYTFSDTGSISVSTTATVGKQLSLSVNDKVQIVQLKTNSSSLRKATDNQIAQLPKYNNVTTGFKILAAWFTADNQLRLRISSQKSGKAMLQMVNMSGQQVMNSSFQMNKGIYEIQTPTPSIIRGIYAGCVMLGNEKEGFKIMK